MAAFVEERVERAPPAANLVRSGFRGEVDAPGYPLSRGVVVRGHRPVTEAVLILSLALDQIELHGGAAVLNAESAKALHPAAHPFAERHVRIHLAHDIATQVEAEVPRGDRWLPMTRPQISEHPRIRLRRAPEEVIEDRE